MRKAAYAGWYAAFGDEESAREWVHEAYAEWAKELGAGRQYSFMDRFSDDIYYKIDSENSLNELNEMKEFPLEPEAAREPLTPDQKESLGRAIFSHRPGIRRRVDRVIGKFFSAKVDEVTNKKPDVSCEYVGVKFGHLLISYFRLEGGGGELEDGAMAFAH